MKNRLKNLMVALWKDESAQGITEYILLLVIVVAIVTLFKGKIVTIIQGKVNDVSNGMGQITTSGN